MDSTERQAHVGLTDAYPVSLVVENLCGGRGDTLVFADISLTLKPGDVAVLRGANGAGKTTLMRTIAGLTKPSRGQVNIVNAKGNMLPAADTAIFAGHLDGVKAPLSVRENMMFWARLYGLENPSNKIESALKSIGIDNLLDRRASTLSAGQKRRLGLARVLIANRPLWLLDEPTASMDDTSQKTVCRLVERHCSNGGTVLIATHDRLQIDGARSVDLTAS